MLHLYGFSPVCIRLCIINAALQETQSPHTLHLYDFLTDTACNYNGQFQDQGPNSNFDIFLVVLQKCERPVELWVLQVIKLH